MLDVVLTIITIIIGIIIIIIGMIPLNNCPRRQHCHCHPHHHRRLHFVAVLRSVSMNDHQMLIINLMQTLSNVRNVVKCDDDNDDDVGGGSRERRPPIAFGFNVSEFFLIRCDWRFDSSTISSRRQPISLTISAGRTDQQENRGDE